MKGARRTPRWLSRGGEIVVLRGCVPKKLLIYGGEFANQLDERLVGLMAVDKKNVGGKSRFVLLMKIFVTRMITRTLVQHARHFST